MPLFARDRLVSQAYLSVWNGILIIVFVVVELLFNASDTARLSDAAATAIKERAMLAARIEVNIVSIELILERLDKIERLLGEK